MKQYNVTGMSCAACSARVKKAVSKVEGVKSCSVSLLTNSMGVEGTAEDAAIIAAVEGAGYGASAKDAGGEKAASPAQNADALIDRETPVLKRRLIASLGFLAVLMYVSMGGVMWGWPLPAFMANNPVAVGLAQLLLSAAVMVINQKFFISGTKGLLNRAPNMDTLVALGSAASSVLTASRSDFAPKNSPPDCFLNVTHPLRVRIPEIKRLKNRPPERVSGFLVIHRGFEPRTP